MIYVDRRTKQCLGNLFCICSQEIQRKLRDLMGANGNVVHQDEKSPFPANGNVVHQDEKSPFPLGDTAVYPSFMGWSMTYLIGTARFHPLPVLLVGCLLFFMAVEYTLVMVPAGSQPYDVGFVWTQSLHDLLLERPALNTVLAAMNTVFVGMQTFYILWTCVVEGRGRPTIAALFMFTCRGILGYTTQLPLPEEFLGSGVDFPVGNVSFFLFFSGHVAGAVIASLDMRRVKRNQLAFTFDTLNALQSVRLLGTRGHYTIDLVAGVGAGWLFDSLAGKYEESKRSTVQKDLVFEPLIG